MAISFVIQVFQIVWISWKLMTYYVLSTKTYQKQRSKSFESGYFRRASNHQSLTGAIPLLIHTGTLGCWVSPLTHYTRLSQPDPPWLPKEVHVDADLSADAGSTWTNGHQWSPLQAIQQNLPPSSWITRACQSSRQQSQGINVDQAHQLLHARKDHWVVLVLGWVTSWEYTML